MTKVETDPAQVEPNRRERKKAETRARIIEKATELFRQHGYGSTTIEDITEASDVAARTFYSYFDAKVDVALAQFEEWARHHVEAMESRPAGETPVEMAAGALKDLAAKGYLTSERLRDEAGDPFPPIAVAVVLSETEPEVAGRVYQVMVAFQTRMTELFRTRLGYPVGSIEPRIIAASITASWFVAVYGFADVVAGTSDPPSTDELGLTGLNAYAEGLSSLWEGRVH
jgi:AcrR family transcriptional regulator